ncbi:hypothetical protein DJ010_09860 [Nocardioides silvaticus]|uniref:Uncharacterized protein n=1 Tax=Nocardioides silvaticus TaxID=2201891 RepID=A0A316TV97_9ACTN|nr:hypothetical protein [Nocardioides silvaticus]PWN03396.1 hypothetical protein DJ010_09860 [Nocardioides silvaticus]
MSAVGTLTKLATDVVGKATHAVFHPRQTVSAVTGHARGLASSVTGGQTEQAEERAKEPPAPVTRTKAKPKTGSTRSSTADGPEVVPAPPRNTEPAEPAEPARSVDPSTTEPKAASRQSAHQGRGADPTDHWEDELDDGEDINPATGQPHNAPDADEPLLDPGVAKSVRAESETLSKAADPDKGE